MRLTKLTIPAQRIVQRLDAGAYQRMTVQEAIDAIEAGTIFERLCERMDPKVPFSVMQPSDRLEMLIDWQDFSLTATPGSIGVRNNGFALILYYLLWCIERRVSEDKHRLTPELALWAMEPPSREKWPDSGPHSGPNDS